MYHFGASKSVPPFHPPLQWPFPEKSFSDDGLASPSRTSASDTSHRRTNQPDMHRVSPNEAGDGVPRFDINHRLILPNFRTQKPSTNHLLRRHASIRRFSRQFQYKIARKGIERNHTVIINHLLTGETIRLLACQCRKASLLRMYPTSQTQQQ